MRRLNDVVAGILRETSGLTLFAETGLPSDRGLIAEFLERFWRRLLPAPREDGDLSKLLVRLFPTHAEAERFATMPPEIFQRLVSAFAPAGQLCPLATDCPFAVRSVLSAGSAHSGARPLGEAEGAQQSVTLVGVPLFSTGPNN